VEITFKWIILTAQQTETHEFLRLSLVLTTHRTVWRRFQLSCRCYVIMNSGVGLWRHWPPAWSDGLGFPSHWGIEAAPSLDRRATPHPSCKLHTSTPCVASVQFTLWRKNALRWLC